MLVRVVVEEQFGEFRPMAYPFANREVLRVLAPCLLRMARIAAASPRMRKTGLGNTSAGLKY